MPWASAMALIRTGCGSPKLAASSSMATQAYSVFEVIRMVSPGKLETCRHVRSNAAAVAYLDDVQAALLFRRAGPAASALVPPVAHRRGAGPAADARVALVMQGIVGNVVVEDE